MKIRPVGAELFHVGRQTDMMKLTVAFRDFENAPKKREKVSLSTPWRYGGIVEAPLHMHM
jgi:hypothetical protein